MFIDSVKSVRKMSHTTVIRKCLAVTDFLYATVTVTNVSIFNFVYGLRDAESY